MKRIVFVLLCFFFATFKPAFADEGWQIEKFDTTLAIQAKGHVAITEKLTVNFHMLEKHGIFRVIPYEYKNDDGSTYYTAIAVSAILRNEAKEPYEVSQNNGNITIKIGDKDTLISGTQHYTIIYTAQGILRPYQEYDELYWNVTGNSWPVPILSASARVLLPSDGLRQVACYEGYPGSSAQCTAAQQNSKEARFASSGSYEIGEGMTIAAGFEKNLVPLISVPRPKTFIERLFIPLNILTFLTMILVGVISIFWLWFQKGRDYWWALPTQLTASQKEKVKPLLHTRKPTVEFTPPEKLRPAELGVLVDERADTLDVSSTIIDLATRGLLTITEKKKTWLFGSMDYILTRTKKEDPALLRYEASLLAKLFATSNEVALSSLKQTFYTELAQVKKQLYQDVVGKKYFVGNPETIRNTYLIFAILLLSLAGGGIVLGLSSDIPFFAAAGAGLLLPSLFFLIMTRSMPRRTALGFEMYQRALGYRLFIQGAEKYRQQFFEKENLFNEILPYAMMFGLTEKFAKAMHDIGVEPSRPTWYHGSSPFRAATFGTHMNAFSTSIGSAMSSTPKSSGSSGGGSSGGGFGGGGGGSW